MFLINNFIIKNINEKKNFLSHNIKITYIHIHNRETFDISKTTLDLYKLSNKEKPIKYRYIDLLNQ